MRHGLFALYSRYFLQVVVGDLVGVSQSTVSRIIKRVSLLIASLVQQHIKFPTTQAERATTMRQFHDLANFPGILGAIDCTHIAIQSPGGDHAELYRNRKGYFSINVQAICDAKLKFTNVVARWYGSAHDSTVFAHSRICAQFELGHITNGHLLGDGGYACKKYLLTPLANTTTAGERSYNFAQIRSRNPVERSFGVLKRRFPCLQLGIRVKLATTLNVIVSCFILHNIAQQHGDAEAPDNMSLVHGRRVYEEIPAPCNIRGTVAGATSARTALINAHFTRQKHLI
jgi:hypothetical protein